MCRFVNILLLCSFFVGYPNTYGAYAYSDGNGNRFGGTYGPDTSPPDYFPDPLAGHFSQDQADFFPEFFRNLQNILQEAFYTNIHSQRIALQAAQKAYDLTSNHAGYFANFPRFVPFNRFPSFPNFGDSLRMDPFAGSNSAMASAVAGPGFRHQAAMINPANPNMPNVDVSRNDPDTNADGPQFVSVSSQSFSSSSNRDGQETRRQGAETVVNKNGVITRYKVGSD